MKVEMDMYYLIRSHHNDGMSIRTIAKTLGISRQTVTKYCDGTTIPGNRKEYHRDSTIITDEPREFILSCFREDEQEGLAKQRHTAKRIYDRLVAEKGFTGGESTIRKAVNDLRKEHSVHPQADIPLEYDPGDAIQIDWGECTVYLNGTKQKLYSFCGRLCYSCDIFVQLFYTQNLESFLEAQQRMFDYFGGVPNRLISDNAKVAVREGFGKHTIATDGYAAFAAHYAFQTDFCNIASGNEKGLVENLVGYSRRNFMVPVPKAKSLEELNAKLIEDCLNYRKTHKVQSRTISVNEAYHEEQLYLHSVPVYRYDTSRTATPEVGDYSTVRFEKNNYSVPVRYLRRTVTVKGYADKVLIMYNGKLIATHDRLFGSGKLLTVLNTTSICLNASKEAYFRQNQYVTWLLKNSSTGAKSFPAAIPKWLSFSDCVWIMVKKKSLRSNTAFHQELYLRLTSSAPIFINRRKPISFT